MLVKYVGSGKLIMTDYNGMRYTFEKDNPKEISPEIFNHIIASGLIEAKDLEIVMPTVKLETEDQIPEQGKREDKEAKRYKRR